MTNVIGFFHLESQKCEARFKIIRERSFPKIDLAQYLDTIL